MSCNSVKLISTLRFQKSDFEQVYDYHTPPQWFFFSSPIKYSPSRDLLTQQAVSSQSEINEARKPLPSCGAGEWRLLTYQIWPLATTSPSCEIYLACFNLFYYSTKTSCTFTAILIQVYTCQLVGVASELSISLWYDSAAQSTGWTNVNLLHFPDSIEIASQEGLTLYYPEISQSKQPLAWQCTILMAWRH